MNCKEFERTEVDKLIEVVKRNMPTSFVGIDANIDHQDGDSLIFEFVFSYVDMIQEIIDEFYTNLPPDVRLKIACIVSSCMTPKNIEYSFNGNIQHDMEVLFSDEEGEIERLLANEEVAA